MKPTLSVRTLCLGPLDTNCHLIGPKEGGPCLVVDPGYEPERIVAALRERQWTPALYLVTHGHFDHVTALRDMSRDFPAPIAMHPADSAWAFNPLPGRIQMFPIPPNPGPIERSLAEGQAWEDLGYTYRVIHTPGHSPGGVCFYFEDFRLLVAGDTLFAGSIGRLDLPLGQPDLMPASLAKLMALPDDVTVLTGHGSSTTIGRERRTNGYILEMGLGASEDLG
jgi:hydroxyacylglutathione hydrolase